MLAAQRTDLISEARRNLVVPVNSRTAQQLLPDLRRLRQGIKRAWLLPARAATASQQGLSEVRQRQLLMMQHRQTSRINLSSTATQLRP